MKLIFATNNKHKIEEIRAALGKDFQVLTLADAGIDIDIPEPHDTLEANASEKSWTIYRLTGIHCFGEDTGLEVPALGGEPGVKSARYAGDERSFDKNIDKLLSNLAGKPDHSAQFRSVISLVLGGKETLFVGVCKGRIIPERRGTAGFGYDPVYIPEGASKTFAEMDMEEKNSYSHRSRAARKLVTYLSQMEANLDSNKSKPGI